MPIEPIVRQAARVLLFDGRDHLLLFRWRPNRGDEFSVWITPGGGLLDGETYEQAAVRELYEETGLTAPILSPCVWLRSHVCNSLGQTFDARERYYIWRCDGTPSLCRSGWTQEELMLMDDYRWWTVDEIIAAENDVFAPRRLGDLLRDLLQRGQPQEPIDVGV